MTQPKNTSIAARIPQLLDKLPPQAAARFRRSFKTQDDQQSEHTFRELVLGAWLVELPCKVEHERRMDNKQTPDWTLLNDQDQPIGIVEVATMRQTQAVEESMVKALDEEPEEAWCGCLPDASERLYASIKVKVEKYQALADQMGVPYVVAIFGHSFAFVDDEDLQTALFTLNDGGVFALSPSLSGVLFFEEVGGKYSFRYHPNPTARHKMPFLEGTT